MNTYREQQPKEKRAATVLREEYEEAQRDFEGLIWGVCAPAAVGMFPAAIGIYHHSVAALPFVVVLWGASVVCSVALWRSRVVVRRWRDQERARLEKE